MCGIVAYLGDKEALPIIISGLEKLEYRGYDSAGVAVYGENGVATKRAQGKLSNLKAVLDEEGAGLEGASTTSAIRKF